MLISQRTCSQGRAKVVSVGVLHSFFAEAVGLLVKPGDLITACRLGGLVAYTLLSSATPPLKSFNTPLVGPVMCTECIRYEYLCSAVIICQLLDNNSH